MRATIFGAVALWALGCGPEAPGPQQLGSFGHQQVRMEHPELASLQDPLFVRVGEIAGYAVQRDGEEALLFTVQGAPEPGVYEVVVRGRGGAEVQLGELEYLTAPHPALARVVAFGASLTMGVQSGGVGVRSQLAGPASQFGRAAGAYLPPPLVKEGLMPSLVVEDMDPSTCEVKGGVNVWELIAQRVQRDLLPQISDRDGQVLIRLARVDAAHPSRNVAVGGMRLGNVLRGAGDLMGVVLEHLVWNPQVEAAGLFDSPEEKMLDRVEAHRPTLVLTTDLFANDYNNVNLGTTGIPTLGALTSMTKFRTDLAEVLARLEATSAEVFIATGPDATVLIAYDRKVEALRQEGYTEEEATSWRRAIQERISQYNAELRAQLAHRPRFHLVDLHSKVEQVLRDGLQVGETKLSSRPLGGLLSLDGLHFSDTGYALLANEFLEAVNLALGTSLPQADLAQVLAADPFSPGHLQAQGLTCAGG